MATTALFVEILVVGAIAELWIVSLLLACLDASKARMLFASMLPFKDFAPVILIFVLAVTYAIGWVTNFVSEWLFKQAFEKTIRNPLFKSLGKRYEQARTLVLLKASADFLREVQLDRHIIRIARTNALSFAVLAVSLLFHRHRVDTAVLAFLIVLLMLLSFASFVQWRRRYTSQYENIAEAVRFLIPQTNDAIPLDDA
jgi:hypothetical protein